MRQLVQGGFCGVRTQTQTTRHGQTTAAPVRLRAKSSSELERLWSQGLVHMLECPPGGVDKAEEELWGSGRFQASVDPDLPISFTWEGVISTALRGGGGPEGSNDPPADHIPATTLRVATVAAQVRTRQAVRDRMVALAQGKDAASLAGDARPVQAFLCLSGSHPARALPLSEALLPASVFSTLQDATRMKASGDLPPGLGLFCVDNPQAAGSARAATLSVDRLQRKIDAGAEAVITQPPLLTRAFERWWTEMEARKVPDSVAVVVGLPVIYSTFSLRLWLGLAGALASPEASSLLAEFSEKERAMDKEEFATWCVEWTAGAAKSARELPGVRGVHLMPVTGKGRKVAVQMLGEGLL